MSEMVKSNNPLFPDMMIEKPKRATVIAGPDGGHFFKCPYCGSISTEDECDVMGAEDNCLFCNQCNREFET